MHAAVCTGSTKAEWTSQLVKEALPHLTDTDIITLATAITATQYEPILELSLVTNSGAYTIQQLLLFAPQVGLCSIL